MGGVSNGSSNFKPFVHFLGLTTRIQLRPELRTCTMLYAVRGALLKFFFPGIPQHTLLASQELLGIFVDRDPISSSSGQKEMAFLEFLLHVPTGELCDWGYFHVKAGRVKRIKTWVSFLHTSLLKILTPPPPDSSLMCLALFTFQSLQGFDR